MKPEAKRLLSFIAIVTGFFMPLLDATIVNIALPEMARHYGESVENISWVVNGYTLAFAVVILTAARLADQFGRKKIFIGGVFLFTLASLLAGFAPNVQVLIVLRVIQGLAGAIVVPVTIPLATEIFPKEMHGMVIGIWGAISGLAAASGPTLGGILTSSYHWQSIFFVNIPLGILTVVVASIFLKESVDPTANKRIDLAGIVSISAAMFCLTYALIKTTEFGWTSPTILLLFAAGLACFILFFYAELKGQNPMLPLWLLRNSEFDAAALTIFVIGAALMNATFLMSFFLTQINGMTVLQAGMTISTMPLTSMLTSAMAGPLSNKWGSRCFVSAGIIMILVSIYLFSGLGTASQQGDVVWRLAIMGLGLGLSLAPAMASAIRNVPPEKIGMASGVTNMTRSLGAVLGVALIVTVLNSNISLQMNTVKQEVAVVIQHNTVLAPQFKDQLTKQLKTLQLTQNGQTLTQKGVMTIIEQKEKSTLGKLPAIQRLLAQALFTKENREVDRILPGILDRFKQGAARGFGSTFQFFSLLLVLGIPFAIFSDRKRAPGDTDVGAGYFQDEPTI